MDGVLQLSQAPIAPGISFTYEFVVKPAGTRWYHSYFNEVTQQELGLAGALIVESRQVLNPRPDWTCSYERVRLWEEVLLTLHLAFSAAPMSSKGTEVDLQRW